jgi:hypothetical protein
MKALLTASALLMAGIASAQRKPLDVRIIHPLYFTQDTGFLPKQQPFSMPTQPHGPGRLLGRVAQGTVYALPLDGMPCIVPDKPLFGLIPNINPLRKDSIDPGIYFHNPLRGQAR